MSKNNEITKNTDQELDKQLQQCKKELMNLRFQKALGELKNTSRFKIVRRLIAKIKTEVNKRHGVKNA